MNFNDDHIRIVEKNRHYYTTLKQSGALNKLSSVIVDEFQRVYTEAIGGKKFPTWCAACIVELIELVYLNYDKYGSDTKEVTNEQKKRGRKAKS